MRRRAEFGEERDEAAAAALRLSRRKKTEPPENRDGELSELGVREVRGRRAAFKAIVWLCV